MRNSLAPFLALGGKRWLNILSAPIRKNENSHPHLCIVDPAVRFCARAIEMGANHGQLHEETVAEHENLFEQYQSLENTLQELRGEFTGFLERTQ